ncbi:hypothetical protein AAFF_G00089330 [Aldrovandia affinis]|uniref:Uncharacterized protein n=1 Tax=Aldrovandia affinis TaxID=143900 RepID=A0AAD7RWA2_9TELE|nr:hypothetical protein AAFF_G00089330 [Aldrovandia affinis]
MVQCQGASGLCFYHARFGAGANKCHPPCSFSRPGDPEGRHAVATTTLSGQRFLCSTGAQVSVLPASPTNIWTGSCGPPLEAANGSVIQTYGKRRAVLCFHGRQFTWDFIVAKVAKRLLCGNFLCANGLFVDVKNCRLVNAEDFGSFPCAVSGLPMTTLSFALMTSGEFSRLLGEFPDPHLSTSNSPWASPLHMVPKPDGGCRPCKDYRRLNDATTPDQYPVPHVQDFLA